MHANVFTQGPFPPGSFANIQDPEARLQVSVYSKQVQVSGGQGLVGNAKMEASPLLFQVEQFQFGKDGIYKVFCNCVVIRTC